VERGARLLMIKALLQPGVVCCSMVQRCALCCSMLQCDAV